MITSTSLLVLTQLIAGTIDINPGDDLWNTLKEVNAGDEVIIHAGTYKVPGFVDLAFDGTQDQPIVVRAGDGEEVIIEGISSQNTFNIQGSYYTLRGLTIVGGSHGIRLGNSAHGTIEGIEIRDVGDVGISCNRPDNTYEAMTIRKNHIHDTGADGGPGECMYLGCNNNKCQVWDSMIEFNWCHDTLSGNQGDGIELKTGSYNNIIRHNVIHDVNYPAITMYGTVGNKAPNIVEGNAIWNVVDNGIQTVGDAVVRNNLIFNVGANGIHAKPSQGEIVEQLTIAHNTVINPNGACLRGNDWPGGEGIVLANNALYCPGGTAVKLPAGAGSALVVGNAVVGAVEGAMMGTYDGISVEAAFLNAAGKEVYPQTDSPLIDAGEAGHADADFNCLARDPGGVDVGAYNYDNSDNPGWVVAPGFKNCASGDSTGTDSDSTDGTDSSGTDSTDGTGGTGSTDSSGTDGSGSSGTDSTDSSSTDSSGTDGSGTDGSSDSGSAGPTGGSASSDGNSTSDSASTSAGDDDNDDDVGCACRTLGDQDTPLHLLGLLALVPLVGRRRRRRAPAS